MSRIWEVQHGTLDVVVASDDAVVVATDSRRTSTRGGVASDDVKKLFPLPHNRVAAIAGLVDVSLPAFPHLTARIPALLEDGIARWAEWDSYSWEDPPPPAEWDQVSRRHWNAFPYSWLGSIRGPLQTVYNIAATFNDGVELSQAALMALVVGFKKNGELKIDARLLLPQKGSSSWGRRVIAVAEASRVLYSRGGFTCATIGSTALADSLLSGIVPPDFDTELRSFPGIEVYLRRRAAGEAGTMAVAELSDLAHDLIRATAARDRTVGAEPLQTAVLRRGHDPEYDQLVPSAGDLILPSSGTWHLGTVFTSEYPFADQKELVMTDCVVSGCRSPIPLGGSFIFGSKFVGAVFRYESGTITFGQNNDLEDCTLQVAKGAPGEPWQPLVGLFSRVEIEE